MFWKSEWLPAVFVDHFKGFTRIYGLKVVECSKFLDRMHQFGYFGFIMGLKLSFLTRWVPFLNHVYFEYQEPDRASVKLVEAGSKTGSSKFLPRLDFSPGEFSFTDTNFTFLRKQGCFRYSTLVIWQRNVTLLGFYFLFERLQMADLSFKAVSVTVTYSK